MMTLSEYRVIERIYDVADWPDNGEARLKLIQAAYDRGLWPLRE